MNTNKLHKSVTKTRENERKSKNYSVSRFSSFFSANWVLGILFLYHFIDYLNFLVKMPNLVSFLTVW